MKNVTIPSQFLQELLALCGPEDHELRERVLKSAAPAHPAEGVPAQALQPQQAMEALKAAMKADPEYAWSWHCAIWSGAHDEGLETGAANRAAARVMHMAFDCDTTKNANFHAAHLAATQPAAQGMDALTPAARDVLAERKRQIETEGWKPERDDVYDTGEMALAAACYAAHSASCAAIKAPHTAPGVFVRTRSAQDFVGEMWPWSDDWWKPSGHRRNLEKAGALVLAEIERIDRAALAAQAKQGGAA
jgi:hypothetical protein